MSDDVKIRIRLIDDASRGFQRLEQKIRELNELSRRLAQESLRASEQSNQQQLSGFQRLVQRERELRERAAEQARRLAQEAARASEQSNQQQLSGFQRLAQRERELRARSAEQTRRLAQETARAAEQALRQEQEAANRAFQHINDARQRLGVRAHAQINADISHIRAAYQQLAQSGTLSFREQAQAADKMRHHITQLTNEMGHLTAAQKRYGALQTGAGVAGAVVGGVAGAAYATVQPIKDAMQYDDRLTNMTNVGYSDRDVAGRQAGKKEIQAVIENAVKDSKGLVDTFGAAQMLDQLLAGGRVPMKQAMGMLPYLTQTAGANAADPMDLARTTNAAYGLKIVKSNEDLQKFWNMSVTAGQASSFELKDQVKFLPEQLAFAITNGSHGLDAAAEVLKTNVTSSGVTGNSDEAGVATSNFLRKQTGTDTQKDYEGFMEEKHKIKGANLIDDMDKAIAKGSNATQFWADFIKRETDVNPDVVKLRKKIADEKDPEKREVLESRAKLRTGEIINELFQDVRATKGVLGTLNTEYGDSVGAKIKAAQAGTFDPNKGNIDFKLNQVTAKTTELGNTLDIQKHHTLQQSFDTIGSTSQKANELAGQHSALATVASFAPQIATGVGAAGAGWAGVKFLASRAAPAAVETAAPTLAANAGVALSRLSGVLSNLTSQAGGALARTPALIGNAARAVMPYAQAAAPWIAKASGVASAGYAGYKVGDSYINPAINKSIAKNYKGNSLGTQMYEWIHGDDSDLLNGKNAAQKTKAPIGTSPFKPAATNTSSPIGALSSVVSKLTSSEGSLSSSVSNLMSWKPEPLPVEVNTQSSITVGLAAGLVIQAQSSQSSSTAQKGANSSTVNTGRADTGNIFNGAP